MQARDGRLTGPVVPHRRSATDLSRQQVPDHLAGRHVAFGYERSQAFNHLGRELEGNVEQYPARLTPPKPRKGPRAEIDRTGT